MFLELNHSSKELKKDTQVNIILPGDKNDLCLPCKTVWLLHGLKGDQTSWSRYTSIERYARKYNLAVIMPNTDRNWYTNTAYGANYFNYITQELPALCYGTFKILSTKREDNIIAGASMGGYGAIKAALTFPDRYGVCISLSGSLDITRKGRPCNLDEWKGIFGFNLSDPLELEGSEHDLFALAEKNKKEGHHFPKLYMWCGLEDSLISVNNRFDQFLTELAVPHTFEVSEGDHSWKYWDMHIQNSLKWLFEDNN